MDFKEQMKMVWIFYLFSMTWQYVISICGRYSVTHFNLKKNEINMSVFGFNFFLTVQNNVYFVALKGILVVLVCIGIQKSHHVKVIFFY